MKPSFGKIAEFVEDALIRARVAEDYSIRTTCSCGKPLQTKDLTMDDEVHDGGIEVRLSDGTSGKRWLYFRCSCGYDLALWKTKIQIPASQEEIEAALGEYDYEDLEAGVEEAIYNAERAVAEYGAAVDAMIDAMIDVEIDRRLLEQVEERRSQQDGLVERQAIHWNEANDYIDDDREEGIQ